MLIAAAVRPTSTSASNNVTASRARCCRFMLMTVSRIARVIPAARTAANDDPYSTRRCSARFHHTRCGMWWTSGCDPVTIDDRHTGVSDGNVETARAYWPRSASAVNAGIRRSPTAPSSIDGVKPSMTMRTALVAGKGSQPGVSLGRAPAQARGECGDDRCLEISDRGNPRERREHDRGKADERRRSEPRPSATQGPGDELCGPERSEHAACCSADRFVPLADPQPDADADAAPPANPKPDEDAEAARPDDGRDEQRARCADLSGDQHPDRNPESGRDADP